MTLQFLTKKFFLVLILAMLVAVNLAAQYLEPPDREPAVTKVISEHRHKAGDMLLGLNWSFLGLIVNKNPINAFSEVLDTIDFDIDDSDPMNPKIDASMQLPNFFATFRGINIGVSYEYYIFHWMSVGTGIGFGPEINLVTKDDPINIHVEAQADSLESTDDAEDKVLEKAFNEASKAIHLQAGLFLTIPFNVHFNIPKVEWLYGGIGIEIHIPLSDMGLSNLLGGDITKYLPGGSIKGKTFVSMPIDIGFDFKRDRSNGKTKMSRLLFRVEPEFFGNGFVSVPLSLVWQSKLWKLATLPIPFKKQNAAM